MRLGEVLIQKGLITQAQLAQALDAQLIYGGHLGTCLVELGLIDLETLGKTLSAAFKANHAHNEIMDNVPPQIICLLPPKLVERHHAIPFALAGRTLRVGMINPCNLLALDELSFATGYKIEAWVAPEILIVRAMERYYGISRKLRYIPLSGGPLLQCKPKAAVPPAPPPAPPASLKPPTEPPIEALPILDVFIPQRVPPSVAVGALHHSGTPAATLEWIKVRRAGAAVESWSNLFALDLFHEHFNGLEGVYVVWHKGRNPVLRVGQGVIRKQLQAMRRCLDLIEVGREFEVFVTWASVGPDRRRGVERYLCEMLSPQILVQHAAVPTIEVNLPR